MPARSWDVGDWYANPSRAAEVLGWRAQVALDEGLRRTARWYAELDDVALYERASKKRALDSVYSVTAIIACYKDGQAIPIMAERLERMFTQLHVDYEIIFVNDGSPDDSEETIRSLSALNPTSSASRIREDSAPAWRATCNGRPPATVPAGS